MWKVTVCLVLTACVLIWAPAIGARSESPRTQFAQQWRIFPHSPLRRGVDEEINARFTRQIEVLGSFFEPGWFRARWCLQALPFFQASMRISVFSNNLLLTRPLKEMSPQGSIVRTIQAFVLRRGLFPSLFHLYDRQGRIGVSTLLCYS